MVLVSTRETKSRAEKLKKHIEKLGTLTGKIVENNGKYEVWAKPASKLISIYIGDVGDKHFASYVKIMQYGPDGEVI
jgi:hypothetical protein